VVHGLDGLDEVSVTEETRVSELNDGMITTYNITPMEFLNKTYSTRELAGGNAATNAKITEDVLTGKKGACRDIVILNAALAIVAGGRAKGIKEGIDIAVDCIDSGCAMRKLQALIELSNS
jgi:anthranilate phosphoribosyltransferase